MNPLTIDMEKLLADVRQADEAVARAEETMAGAARQLEAARSRRAELEGVLTLVRSYAVDADGHVATGVVPPGPLAGKSAMHALEEYAGMHPGAVVKVEETWEAMKRFGFEGTLNALQVAFSSLSRAGRLPRLKKGTYKFPGDGESTHPHSDSSNGAAEPWVAIR